MPHPIARTYVSLGAFYADDPARRASRERDIGLFWRSAQGLSFRAAWIQDTAEVYLFQHAVGGPGGGSVHLLRAVVGAAELERRLLGWQEVCGRPRSLEWLLARMDDGEPAPPAPRRRHARRPLVRFGGVAGAAA